MLASVRTVIVDEIHALARDKRGSHLALSLERLDRLVADGSPGPLEGSSAARPAAAASANLTRLTELQGYLTVRAPFAGVIQSRSVVGGQADVGDDALPGDVDRQVIKAEAHCFAPYR